MGKSHFQNLLCPTPQDTVLEHKFGIIVSIRKGKYLNDSI